MLGPVSRLTEGLVDVARPVAERLRLVESLRLDCSAWLPDLAHLVPEVERVDVAGAVPEVAAKLEDLVRAEVTREAVAALCPAALAEDPVTEACDRFLHPEVAVAPEAAA